MSKNISIKLYDLNHHGLSPFIILFLMVYLVRIIYIL